jgi:hypothetical protein
MIPRPGRKVGMTGDISARNQFWTKSTALFSSGIGMSYDVIIEPRHDFYEPVIRYQWRAAGCPNASADMPSRTQPRVFIAHEPVATVYCSKESCREKRGDYASALVAETEDPELGEWTQFDWSSDATKVESSSNLNKAHLVATILDDLTYCAVAQMRCIEVAGSKSPGDSYHRAFWNDEGCVATVFP